MSIESKNNITAFFEPESVAVFGSLREIMGTAYWVIHNMRKFGYSGPIYPINPNPSGYKDVFGLSLTQEWCLKSE